jgi:very-short-patch-repair endonuclease
LKGECELILETLLKAYGHFGYERAYVYGDGKKHFDFAWPDLKICIEVQEELYHRQWNKQREDAMKANWCVENGWKLLHVTGKMLKESPAVFMDCLGRVVTCATLKGQEG